MKKKKIIFVEYFSFLGGGQIVFLNLIKNLKFYYDIKVLLFNNGVVEKELKKLKLDFFVLNAPQKVKYRYFWTFPIFLFKLYNFLKKEKPDLIYANCFFAVKLLYPVLKILKIKVIWHKHIIIEKSYNSYLAKQIRKCSKIVDKIICVSQAVKDSMMKIGVKKEKLVVIYNGIEFPNIDFVKQRKKMRKKFNIKNAFLIGTIGFFRENKGFDIFIKTAKFFRDKNIKFMLVGKSDLKDDSFEIKLKNLIKQYYLENKIIMPGYIERFKILPAFDLFVLPSLNEPFGLITIEAGVVGLPVIGFKSGGTKEIIENNKTGFLVNEINENALSKKIKEIMKDKKRLKKIGLNLKKDVIKRFNIKKQIKEIKNLIDSI